jgi:hypothetical protein
VGTVYRRYSITCFCHINFLFYFSNVIDRQEHAKKESEQSRGSVAWPWPGEPKGQAKSHFRLSFLYIFYYSGQLYFFIYKLQGGTGIMIWDDAGNLVSPAASLRFFFVPPIILVQQWSPSILPEPGCGLGITATPYQSSLLLKTPQTQIDTFVVPKLVSISINSHREIRRYVTLVTCHNIYIFKLAI